MQHPVSSGHATLLSHESWLGPMAIKNVKQMLQEMQQTLQQSSFVPPPPPTLNGGLYTGAPFAPDAPWRNFPVIPDAGFYNYTNLATVSSALPLAQSMVPGGSLRPGNNTPLMPSDISKSRLSSLNAICMPDSRSNPMKAQMLDPDQARGFAGGFMYL